MSRIRFKLMLCAALLFISMAGLRDAQSSQLSNNPIAQLAGGDDFFEKKIRPILADNCYACHSSKMKKPMGGLVLDTKAGWLNGGASGPGEIVPRHFLSLNTWWRPRFHRAD